MSQQIIDIGAAANDGTGEPLRSAFNAVNENFTEVYAAGPVGSNVTISGNTITVSGINNNLVLAANGIGNVQSNSTIMPSVDAVYDIGSANMRFGDIHGTYIYGNGAFLTGIAGGGSGNAITNGDSSVAIPAINGNVSVTIDGRGNVMVVQRQNVVLAANLIPSANVLYNLGSANTAWKDLYLSNSTIYLGNSTIQSNATSFTLTTPAGGALVFQGNGIVNSYANANVAGYLLTNSGNIRAGNVSATGNVTGQYIIGDGGFLSNIVFSGNVAVSQLGNGTTVLRVEGSGGNLTTTVGGVSNVQVTTPAGVDVIGNINATANISANYVLGNGSQLTGLPELYTNANVAAYLPTYTGNLVALTGNVITTANVTGNYILGNGSQLSGMYSNTNVAAYLPTYTGNITAGNLNVTSNVSATGNISAIGSISAQGNVRTQGTISALGNIVTDGLFIGNFQGNITGNLTVPGSNTQVLFNGQGNAAAAAGFTYNSDSNTVGVLGIVSAQGNVIAGNVNTVGNVSANYYFGNGSALTSIAGANVTGTVAVAAVSGAVTTNAQPNITSVGTLSSVSVAANVTGGNLITTGLISAAGQVTGNQFNGSGAGLTSIPGANVSGVVPSATTADTVTTAAQPNITSVGTLTSLSVSGNIDTARLIVNNIASDDSSILIIDDGLEVNGDLTAGNVNANYYLGNGSQLTGLPESYGNANVAAYLPTYTGNLVALTGNVTTTANISGNFILGNGSQLTGMYSNTNVADYLPTYTGNLASLTGNVTTTGNISGNFILGNGSQLTGLPESYGNANVAAYLPTYTGNLVALTGNVTTTANISGSFLLGNGAFISGLPAGYSNAEAATFLASGNNSANIVTTANVSGSFLLGNGAFISGLSVNYGNTEVAAFLPTYTGNLAALTGNVTTTANVTGGNVSTVGLVSATGNVTGGNVSTGGLITATGNVTGGNINTAGLISATSNIIGGNVSTSGTITATGNITSGNVNTTNLSLTGNVVSALNVTGNITGGNIASVGALTAAFISSSGNIVTGSGSGGNITGANVISGTTFSASGNVAAANINAGFVSATGNVISGNIVTAGQVSATGNVTGGNISTAGTISATGNISGNFILGNGAFITGLPANYGNTQVAEFLPTYTGNLVALTGNVTTTGNVTGGNVLTGGLVSATGNITGNTFIGSGAGLSAIPGANVTGTVPTATTAATVTTAAQPNITSVGTLTSVSVTGNVVGGNISTANTVAANILTVTTTASIGGNLNMNSQNITSLANPVNAQDAVTKTYVDTLVASGIHFHDPVRVESPINLTATYNNGTAGVGATLTNSGTQAALIIDGITMVVADRVLVYEQTDETQNGIYVVSDVGSVSTNWVLTRASDADTYVINSADGLSEGSSVFVQQGTTGAGELYTCNTAGVITFGTTNITFAQINSAQIYSAGTGLTLTGTQFSIANTAVTLGSYGSGDQVATFTVNGQGQLTGAANTAITANAANLTGTVLNSSIVTSSLTSVGTLGALSVTGNVTGGNINGNGSGLTNITGANVTGQVANALVAGTVYTNAQPNITSVGTLSSLSVTGNVDAGNVNGNGSGLSSLTGANVTGQVANALVAGTVYTNAQPNITSVGTLSSLSVTGNVDAGNINGNGSGLTNITAANVTGQVANALIAGTVYTNAQPNITSVGTLSSLSVTGNVDGGNIITSGLISATGKLDVGGQITTTRAGNAATNGGQIFLNGLTNNRIDWNTEGTGAPEYTTRSAGAKAVLYPSISGSATDYALGVEAGALWSGIPGNDGGQFFKWYGGNVLVASLSGTGVFSATGNVTGSNINGNGSGLSSITGANVTGQVANALIAGTVYTNAQPNITSVGTLSSLSIANTASIGGNLNMNSQNITGVANPVNAQDAVTKTYVDTLVATGIHFHDPVRVESPINLVATYDNGTAGVGATLTNAGTQAALIIDGITMVVADRVLIYEQTNETENGIYVVTDIGSVSTNWILTRASDADTYVINSADGLSEGSSVFVQQGTTGAGELYTCNTAGVITFGTTNITFAQVNSAQIYSAGTGLALVGTQFSIANTAVTAGSYGTGDQVATFTVNGQGQLTAAANTAITANAANLTGTVLNSSVVTSSLTSVGTLGTLSVTGNVTSTGNISGNFFIGNGSQLTGLPTPPSAFSVSANASITSCISGTGGTGDNNFFAGTCAGASNATGGHNTFIGLCAGLCNTTGSDNNFFGRCAGRSNTTGRDNTFIGLCAGFANTTGSDNTFFGRYAGQSNTTGRDNTFIGHNAGLCNTTGSYNFFAGRCAGRNNTTGNYNTFIGRHAGQCNTTGSDNTFMGRGAGRANTSGSYNTFIGRYAGRYNTFGSNNTFIGCCAGRYNTTGSNNTFFGNLAGRVNSTGSNNFFAGTCAGLRNTSGSNNIFFGFCAGQCNTTSSNNFFAGLCAGCRNTGGYSNNFFGFYAGLNNQNGKSNNFFGQNAGRYNSTGNHNNFFGQSAGTNNSTGSDNFFSGALTGRCNTTGNNNIFFGFSAGCYNSTGSDNFFAGQCAGLCNTTGSNNTFIGCQAGYYNSTGSGNFFAGQCAGLCNTTGSNNTFIGCQAGCCNTTGCNNTIIGGGALGSSAIVSNEITLGNSSITRFRIPGIQTSASDGDVLTFNAAQGILELQAAGGGGGGEFALSGSCGTIYSSQAGTGGTGISNFFAGFRAGLCNTTGGYNTFIGFCAGVCNTTGNHNNFFGLCAGRNNTTGSYNFFAGLCAGFCNTSGCYNTFIGRQAGFSNTFGRQNFFAGREAGLCNTTGCYNTFIGASAGRTNTTGRQNFFAGVFAGCANTTGSHNTFIGECAGRLNTIGSYNFFAGFCAGYSNTTGTDNTFIGRQAGFCNTFGRNNFFAGTCAGFSTISGCHNTFIGCLAGSNNTTGCSNFFAGLCAGRCNTTGTSNNFFGRCAGLSNTTGSNNNFFGNYAGRGNTTGGNNNFIGTFAGVNNTIGDDNNFIGRAAGTCNISGNYNTFIGHCAGCQNVFGRANTYIGFRAGETAVSGNNNTFIGCFAGNGVNGLCGAAPMNNTIIMGNNSVTAARIQLAWTAVSDIRDKCVFGLVPHGRGFLQNLKPIEYAFKDRETGCITDLTGKRRYGFSAQELLVAEGQNPVIVDNSNDEKLMVTSDYIIPVLVNAVNELSAEIDLLKSRLSALES